MDNQNVNKAPGIAINYQKLFRLVALGIVAVILLVLVISIVVALIPDKFGTPGSNSVVWHANDDGNYTFVFNGSKKAVELDEKASEINVDASYDSKYCVAVVYREDGKELFVVNSKKAESVAEEVTDYTIAEFENKFAYISDGDLYYGDLSNPKKAKKIDSDVIEISAISPDGSAFAYVVKDGDSSETYVCDDGKKGEKFEKEEADIFAIANKAKYVYYENESKSYVSNGKDKSKLADGDVDSWVINRDGSQMLYSAESDGKNTTFFVNQGKEKIKLKSGYLGGVLTPEGAYGIDYDAINVSSFEKCAINMDSNVYLLKNKKGDVEKISDLSDAVDGILLSDAKTCIFVTDDGDLKACDITKPNKNATEYDLGKDITNVWVSSDGKHIYVEDRYDRLYYVNSKKKMTGIDSDVSDVEVMDNGKVYYISDETLYTANKKASSAKKVEGAGDAMYLEYIREADDLFVVTEGKFMSVSGKKATRIFDLAD